MDAVTILNETSENFHHAGSGWFDTKLHIRHIAFVYGIHLKFDEKMKLIQVQGTHTHTSS